MEELLEQIHIEATHGTPGVGHVHHQAGTAGQVNHNTGKGFVQRHIGVTITANAFFVTHGLFKGLAKSDTDILHCVMVINVQVTLRNDIQIHQAVTSNLIHHVLQEGHASVEAGFAGTVEIDLNGDLGFKGISFYPSLAFGHGDSVTIERHSAGKIFPAIIPFMSARVPQPV